MRILTTTLCYPTPAAPEQGIFILRRAAAVANRPQTDVQVVAPQPWCPLLRRGRSSFPRGAGAIVPDPLPVSYPRLVSVPVLGWAADGLAFAHALTGFVRRWRARGRSGFDLIDAHFVYPDGVGAWLAGRSLGIPVVVTVRGKIVSLSRRTLRRWQIHLMLRGVAARVAVSKSLAGWVHKVGGSDLDVDVIPNGVDADVFHPLDRQRTRATLGWEPATRYILAVGHLQRLKGFDRLVSIMPAVRAAVGDVRLILVGSYRGERSFQAKLLRRITAVNRSTDSGPGNPCVQFIGPASGLTLNDLYNAADLTVNGSRSEGWSNVISESLAAGTPVVATDVGGNREQIINPALGTIVPDGDAPALAQAVAAALRQTWDHAAIARHGAARNWQQTAQQVHAVFARVLAAAQNSPAAPITDAPPFASKPRYELASSRRTTDLLTGETP